MVSLNAEQLAARTRYVDFVAKRTGGKRMRAFAANMSDFMENKLIDFLFRAAALTGISTATAAAATGPATLYIALFTTTPTDSTGGTEVSGGSYARVSVTSALTAWAGTQSAGSTSASSGTSGTTSNNNAITFPAPTANWGTVTGFGILDATSAGNLLFWAALTTSKTVNNGDAAPSFAAAALTVQLDN
jgi:hypothetical protein